MFTVVVCSLIVCLQVDKFREARVPFKVTLGCDEMLHMRASMDRLIERCGHITTQLKALSGASAGNNNNYIKQQPAILNTRLITFVIYVIIIIFFFDKSSYC